MAATPSAGTARFAVGNSLVHGGRRQRVREAQLPAQDPTLLDVEIASIIADLGGDAERGALRRGLMHEAARCKVLLDWQGAELLMKRQLEMPDSTA